MNLSEKEDHLKSGGHKQINSNINKFFWDICDKAVENKARHFQSELHILKSRLNHNESVNKRTLADELSVLGVYPYSIITEKTYIELKIRTHTLEDNVNLLLSCPFFPRFKCKVSYLAKFIKYVIDGEDIIYKWL